MLPITIPTIAPTGSGEELFDEEVPAVGLGPATCVLPGEAVRLEAVRLAAVIALVKLDATCNHSS